MDIPAKSLKPELTRGAVFLVEDDDALRTAMKFCLEIEGYAVEAFETGEHLLRCSPRPVACLVIDYGLPGLNGLALLARLRALGMDAPAMLLTTHPNAFLRVRAASVGARIVEKPLMEGEILRAVSAAISNGLPN